MSKPILCLDFDGVVHAYSRGWQDGTIYDGVTEGFFEWARRAAEHFSLVVFSSRSRTEEGIDSMRVYVARQFCSLGPSHAAAIGEGDTLYLYYPDTTESVELSFPAEKPPAKISIDDRALTFSGDWSHYDPETLLQFKPWNDDAGVADAVQSINDIDTVLRLLCSEHRRMRLALMVIASSDVEDADAARRVAKKTLDELAPMEVGAPVDDGAAG